MTSEAEVPPSIGLVGGKYQLIKLIGRGGMGSVWEARHASLGTPSAIKFIEAEYANSAEARSRFDKEAKAAATIQSKHAIQIYDHGVTDDGKPYIVMELLNGEPLDKRIERLGSLTLQDTAKILQQVGRGLARAHERGIIHRDLKPENIFIVRNTDDDEEVAKVLDFGIAKMSNSPHNPGITSSTKTGAVLGTPFYMSPEQARGLRNVDHRTDVWSLGVIAFKCITGRLPFDGESVGDLLVKICTAPIPIPSQWVPGLPQAFDTWFMRALEREPERRFANVTELTEHLAFTAGLGSRATMPTPQGMQGMPMSATVAANSGGAYSGGTPYSGQRGSVVGHDTAAAQSMGMAQSSMGTGTPHPGNLTAAGLSSSQSVPGVGGPSKWKWVVGAAFVGLAVAGLGTGVAVMLKKKGPDTTVGLTQAAAAPAPDKSGPPPAASDTAQPPPVAANAEPPAAPAAPLGAAPPAAAGKTTVAGKAAAGSAKTGTAAKAGVVAAAPPAALPPPGAAPPVAAAPPAAAPPAAAAPAATPAKKPTNKNDPGY